MLNEITENFYFSENEAKTYLAALELGRSRVSAIAKRAGLNRITAYEILKRLVQIGAANSALYGNIQTFTVAPPDILIQKMESRINIAKKLLPQLTAVNRTNEGKPSISYYDGVEGIRTLYEDSLTCKSKTIYNIANPQNLLRIIGDKFFEQYLKKRIRQKISVKVLMPDNAENKKYLHETTTALREIRYFDGNDFDLPNEIIIYDNKVAMLSFSSLIGVLVEDSDIAKSMLTMWKMGWKK
ncbi:MAG: helix-turn-helix domain-containing protein [Patescibacteria group bacterium]